ncbi:hypothetical protein Tcan_15856 [Toxocara canis]|uniref:Uncharacterized protein n=1 Tax=Toxocara canis TaxID=6265 RepID=A0A0B2UZ93_TOXCA|nr:hypothetical protein Tcan_15856 [Toxocara canis]
MPHPSSSPSYSQRRRERNADEVSFTLNSDDATHSSTCTQTSLTFTNITVQQQPEITKKTLTHTTSLFDYFLPKQRIRLLNFGYFCRPRGAVKLIQTLLIVAYIVSCTQLDYSSYYLRKYVEERVLFTFASYMFIFNAAIIIAYTAFPNTTIKNEAARNGMLFLEIAISTPFCIFLIAFIPVRIAQFVYQHFCVEAMVLLSMVEFPLALTYISDLSFLVNEWTLPMRIGNTEDDDDQSRFSKMNTMPTVQGSNDKSEETSQPSADEVTMTKVKSQKCFKEGLPRATR